MGSRGQPGSLPRDRGTPSGWGRGAHHGGVGGHGRLALGHLGGGGRVALVLPLLPAPSCLLFLLRSKRGAHPLNRGHHGDPPACRGPAALAPGESEVHTPHTQSLLGTRWPPGRPGLAPPAAGGPKVPTTTSPPRGALSTGEGCGTPTATGGRTGPPARPPSVSRWGWPSPCPDPEALVRQEGPGRGGVLQGSRACLSLQRGRHWDRRPTRFRDKVMTTRPWDILKGCNSNLSPPKISQEMWPG